MEPVAYGLRRQSVRFYRILTMETTKTTQIKKLLNSLIFKCCIIFNQVLNALSRWSFFKIIFSEKKVSESRFVFPDFRILKILKRLKIFQKVQFVTFWLNSQFFMANYWENQENDRTMRKETEKTTEHFA